MWQPQPTDTDDVDLPQPLNEILETLYRHAHDIWARKRITDGWQYGPHRDDNELLHPDLVPYDDLSLGEQSYDQALIVETLRLLIKLGFTIERQV